ncbi:MAG: hypothetical protein A2X36_11155 [Elusimicrobia bacterium GWA2_69_24]|nr:MAG: hypothetical protein A2X36_11155 [Elusimicrobia bacterium GWA2_69_24]
MQRILVVDDEHYVRDVIARTLKMHGLAALPACSTQEALAALAGQQFDAILIDIVLGPENGWETLRQIRQSNNVPIVMMSGVCVDDDIRLDAEKLGAQDVLPKPFTADQLMNCIARLLESKPDR